MFVFLDRGSIYQHLYKRLISFYTIQLFTLTRVGKYSFVHHFCFLGRIWFMDIPLVSKSIRTERPERLALHFPTCHGGGAVDQKISPLPVHRSRVAANLSCLRTQLARERRQAATALGPYQALLCATALARAPPVRKAHGFNSTLRRLSSCARSAAPY
jgi:hypothetical protein